ncbi:MAG: N-acetylmuramoyl-L-alanine amidase [Anaerostipes sp.]|nr:N-acetylmuramoyl-L-alanine amidase [Anaerostipes sp.]
MLASSIHPASAISAGTKFKVQYTHNKKTYTKKALNARYNNTVIKTNMPGFLDGSTSMYSAYWIFGRCKSLGTSYKYTSKTKKITIKKGSKTVIMTLNSKKATLNGKSFTLPAAPRKVRYVAKKKNYIMVPGQTVAGKLGISYTWNNRLLSGVMKVSSSSSSTSGTTASPAPSAGQVTAPKTKITAGSSNYSVRIKKPAGLSSASVTSEDDYWNKRLVLNINGNYKTHFSSASNRNIKDSLSYSVSYTGGKTKIYLTTSSIKGFSITQDSNYIYVKYAAPKSMFSRVIVVDAGHGGSDSGAVGNGLYEKNMTLSIVQKTKYYFDRNANYKVYYTRLSDWYPSLSYRYQMANSVGADRFVSVHINDVGKISYSAKGTETLYNPKGGKAPSPYSSLTGKALAGDVHKKLKSATGFSDRGLKERVPGVNGVAVLTYSKTAATLGEVGFISNPDEASSMKNNYTKIGKAFYDGILASF